MSAPFGVFYNNAIQSDGLYQLAVSTFVFAMPISLRLPVDVDGQIASYSARLGLSKSAVIMRSIEEFLAKNAQPSAYQLYLDAMASAPTPATPSAKGKALDGHKLAVQKALQRKHKERTGRAAQALQNSARKAA